MAGVSGGHPGGAERGVLGESCSPNPHPPVPKSAASSWIMTFNSTRQLEPFWIYHLGGLSASWTLLDTAKLMEKGKIQNDGAAAETTLLWEWKT